MKYTLQSGVEHPLLPKFTDNLRFKLPLVAILLLMVIFGLSHHGGNQRSPKPLTLGIYTVKTPDSTNSSPNGSTGGSGSGSASGGSTVLTGPTYQSLIGPPTSSSSTPSVTTPAVSSPVTTGGGGSGGTGGGSGGVSSPVGTVVCTGISSLPITCALCTNPVSLTTGQKAILNSDGTCTVIDP